MGSTVASECLSEQMTALKDFSYQLVTISLRLIAEVLGLGLVGSITSFCMTRGKVLLKGAVKEAIVVARTQDEDAIIKRSSSEQHHDNSKASREPVALLIPLFSHFSGLIDTFARIVLPSAPSDSI